MKTASQWLNPWRKPAGSARQARQRRHWHLDLLARAATAGDEDDGDDGFDSNWFASSRALAQGLHVTEHMAPLEAVLRAGSEA